MPSKIAILEDDYRRTETMRSCLRRLFPLYEINVFDGAPEMIRWLESNH